MLLVLNQFLRTHGKPTHHCVRGVYSASAPAANVWARALRGRPTFSLSSALNTPTALLFRKNVDERLTNEGEREERRRVGESAMALSINAVPRASREKIAEITL